MGAGLLAAVVILAAISIGRVLKPIQRARDVAEEIAAGNLAARIPQATSQDDFGKLAESFNRMTDNLAQKIGELEHVGSLQARFVSDVSHELRTPWPRCGWPPTTSTPPAPACPRTPSGPPCCWNASWSGSRTCSRTSWRSAASTPG